MGKENLICFLLSTGLWRYLLVSFTSESLPFLSCWTFHLIYGVLQCKYFLGISMGPLFYLGSELKWTKEAMT